MNQEKTTWPAFQKTNSPAYEKTNPAKEPAKRSAAWPDAPMVFVELPACPHCGAVITRKDPAKLIRTADGGDGSKSQKCECRHCDGRFIIVFDVP